MLANGEGEGRHYVAGPSLSCISPILLKDEKQRIELSSRTS